MKYLIVFAFLLNVALGKNCTVTQNVEMIKDAMVVNSDQYSFSFDAAPTTVTEAAAVCSNYNYFSLYTPEANSPTESSKGSRCGQLAYGQYVWAGYAGSVYATEECVCDANQYRLDYEFVTSPRACLEAAKYAWDTTKDSSARFYVTDSGAPDLSVSWEECLAYSRGEATKVTWSDALGCIIHSDGRVYYNEKDGGYSCASNSPTIKCVQKSTSASTTFKIVSSGAPDLSVSEQQCKAHPSYIENEYRINTMTPGCIIDGSEVSWNVPYSENIVDCGADGGINCVELDEYDVGFFSNRPFGLKESLNPNNFDPTDTSNQCGPCGDGRVLGTCWSSEQQCSQNFYYAQYGDRQTTGCYLYSPDATRNTHRIVYAENSFDLVSMSRSDPVVVYNGKYDLLSNMPKNTECKNCSSVPDGHIITRPCGDAYYNNFLRDTGTESCVPGKNYAANSGDTTCTPCTKINYATNLKSTTAACTTSSDTVLASCNGTLEPEHVLTYEECQNISILSRQEATANAVDTYPGVKLYGTWNGWFIGLHIGAWSSIAPASINTFDGPPFSYGSSSTGRCRLYNSPTEPSSHRIVWDGSDAFSTTPEIVFSNGQYRLDNYYRKCNPVCGPGYGGNHCSLCAINEYNAVASSIGTACNKKKCPVGKGSPKLTNYNASQVDSETEDCVDCPQGEFSPNDDDGQCSVCSTVKAGHETVSLCTAVADTVTQPCDSNSYQPEEKLGYENVSCIPFPAITPNTGKYVEHSLKITGLTKQQADAKKPQIRKGIASALGKNVEDIKDLSIQVSNSRRRRLLEQPAVLVEYNIVVLDQAAADTLINSLENTNFQTSLEGELGSNVGVESNNPVYIYPVCKTKGYDNYVDSSTLDKDDKLCACDDGKVYALFEFIGCITWVWFIFIIVGTVLVLICISMLIYTWTKNNKFVSAGAQYQEPLLATLAYQPRRPRYQF